jgi:prepilin-type N-terminal cleavage/methylation domain-containing protein
MIKMRYNKGFSLVEMSFVLVIIGLILSGIFGASQLLENSKANDAMTSINDLKNATAAFKNQFSYLPGDWMYTANEIPNVTAGNGNGDGLIGANESVDALSQLFNAGFIRTPNATTAYGAITLINTAASGVAAAGFPPSVKNVIILSNLPCNILNMIDLKLDDGNLIGGYGMSSAANCVAGGVNDPMPFYGFSLE